MNWMMSKWCIEIKVLLLLTVTAITGCSNVREKTSRVEYLPYYNEATFTPRWLVPGNVTSDFHQIPSFTLYNQLGEKITEQHLNGKITVVDFFFTTCPGICPKMTNNMLLVQEAFNMEDGVQIFSHSVTPAYDSVEVLKDYARIKGINSDKWQLLTGERSVIYDLGRNQYFVEEDLGLQKDPEDFIHTENFLLIDQNRRIRGIYNGLNKTAVNQLITDAKTLL
ncbi:protein SCO1/2 [Reichenbachiella faecimaris]|uniref:Protein SCO1/2 n=1 Tax=Reichenbachiella faecimaris TaxID=692418 RepID=A0A1W2G6V9_REIFA|nr:SCO family protein [Reichenbachiella faecimaris]SMD32254.1 protein SCO1/2 [Reichenbachiella faecimaris]